MTSRWEALPGSVAEVRTYLNQLPRDVAEKIAYKNAERLFPLELQAGLELGQVVFAVARVWSSSERELVSRGLCASSAIAFSTSCSLA